MEKNKTIGLKECFNLLDAEYGDKLTEQQRIFKKELFRAMIGVYDNKKIEKMVIKLIRTRPYNSFPKISEMVEIIEGKKGYEAELAWIYLMEKVEQEGYYNSVSFPEYPATGGVIKAMGGWLRFLDSMTDDQEKWIKKEFIKLYPILKERGKYPKSLPGYFKVTNTRKGYDESILMKGFCMTIDGRKTNQRKQISQKGVMLIKKESTKER